MSQPRKKARRQPSESQPATTAGPAANDEHSMLPDEPERSTRADPDGRTPPDHQRHAREAGRPPEQKVVEEAREGQAPPLNPDETDEDLATEG
jgi:hypothetical protein